MKKPSFGPPRPDVTRPATASEDDPLVRRRDLLRAAGVAAAAGMLGCATVTRADRKRFDEVCDVAVVGSGAAGASAAVFAHDAGAQVVLLEKGLLFGGTTAKSGGVYWIPNNRFLRERGQADDRASLLRTMAERSYPHLFNRESPTLGLPRNEYELLVAFYDNAAPAVEALERSGALISQPADQPFGPMPDYFDTTREDAVPRDRRLWPKKPDGSFGLGDEMVRQLRAALEQRAVPLRMGHRVVRLLTNRGGEVVGLEAERPDKTLHRVRAKRAVIFASGGFTHNRDLTLNFQPGPIYGGCAVPTNEGDFVYMATSLGAKLGHMASAWYAQVVLEQALQFSSTPDDVFMPPGDSMILVNRYGRRVVNETSNYNERTRVHFAWDPVTHEWPNRFLFMIYDVRTAELFGGRFPLPPPGTSAPYVVTGATPAALAQALETRLARLADKTGGFRLAPGFTQQLVETIARYNGFAERGRDDDFDRGGHLYDRLWHSRIWSYPNPGTRWPLGKTPNPTMHPIDTSGPLSAIILAAGTLDTHGGPVVNAKAQVIDSRERAIPGLYGAGNAVASATGPYYYGGGGTLGPALAFAYLAARHAAKEREKEIT